MVTSIEYQLNETLCLFVVSKNFSTVIRFSLIGVFLKQKGGGASLRAKGDLAGDWCQ